MLETLAVCLEFFSLERMGERLFLFFVVYFLF